MFWNSDVDIFGDVVDNSNCRVDENPADEYLNKMWRLLVMYFWIWHEIFDKKFSYGTPNPYCH